MRIRARIEAAAAAIASTAPQDEDAIGFLHGVFCSVGLPRRNIQERSFQRTSGRASLLVEAGRLWDGREWIPQPVPYGPIPRLMLAWICTQAVQRQARDIWIGESAAEFLRLIGKTPNGGHAANPEKQLDARGGYAALHRQARALAACSLSLGFEGEHGPVTESQKLIVRFEAWRKSDERQKALWSPSLTLSAEFAEGLMRHAVPIDFRALRALNSSALAMDLYQWLAYRLCRLSKSTFLPWRVLRDQFGQEYRSLRDFKRELRPCLKRALAVYPDARVVDELERGGGILIRPSRPPVAPVAVQNPVNLAGYPRDIAPHVDATLPPTSAPKPRDITPHLIPISVSYSRTDSREVV